jgi:hypothetical protein
MIFIFAMGIVVAIVVGLLLLFVAVCCCHCWLVKSIFRKIQTMANANAMDTHMFQSNIQNNLEW